MHFLIYISIVFFVVAAGIAHFILLLLKTDRDADISYHVVAAPAFIAYGLGALFLSVLAILWFLVKRHVVNGFAFLAMAVLLGGSLWTQVLLARKFDFTDSIRYLDALLPFTIAILISGILFIIGIIIAYSARRKELVLVRKEKKRNKKKKISR